MCFINKKHMVFSVSMTLRPTSNSSPSLPHAPPSLPPSRPSPPSRCGYISSSSDAGEHPTPTSGDSTPPYGGNDGHTPPSARTQRASSARARRHQPWQQRWRRFRRLDTNIATKAASG